MAEAVDDPLNLFEADAAIAEGGKEGTGSRPTRSFAPRVELEFVTCSILMGDTRKCPSLR